MLIFVTQNFSSLFVSSTPQSGHEIQSFQVSVISTNNVKTIARWLLQLNEFDIIVVTLGGFKVKLPGLLAYFPSGEYESLYEDCPRGDLVY